MNIELAKSEWWESLTYKQQKEHLENHPKSTKKITKKPSENKRRGRKPSNKLKEPKQLELKFKFRKDTSEKDRVKTIDSLKEIERTLKKFTKNNYSILAAGALQEFKRYGSTAILNQKVESTADLAAVMQIYRDPTIETFRLIYTKNGKIVGHNTCSVRLPNAVTFKDVDVSKTIIDDINSLGADTYYMVHNHPSGNSSPSRADTSLTEDVSLKVYDIQTNSGKSSTRFGGHVVINHEEYSVIDEYGSTNTIYTDAFKHVYDKYTERKPHNVLYTQVAETSDLAYVTAQLTVNAKNPNDNLLIINGNDNIVKFVTTIPDTLFGENYSFEKTAPYIRKILKDVGGVHRFLGVKKVFDENNFRNYLKFLTDDMFTDVVDANGVSLMQFAMDKRLPRSMYTYDFSKRDLLGFKGKAKFKGVNK